MPFNIRKNSLPVVLLIWVGACIAANMIAAPAKFQVADLTLPVALQVGRVQFQWVGYFETAMALFAVVTCLNAPRRVQLLFGAAIILFVVQRALILPQLSERTDLVIAGQSFDDSHLHLYFIACECAKIVALLIGATAALFSLTESA